MSRIPPSSVLRPAKRFLPILFCKECRILYRINDAQFTEFRFITDIGDGVRNDLESFLESCERIVLSVDCENSDPYKLCAVLGGLREAALHSDDADSFSKLQKIILYDDVHTVDAWDILIDYRQGLSCRHCLRCSVWRHRPSPRRHAWT